MLASTEIHAACGNWNVQQNTSTQVGIITHTLTKTLFSTTHKSTHTHTHSITIFLNNQIGRQKDKYIHTRNHSHKQLHTGTPTHSRNNHIQILQAKKYTTTKCIYTDK